MTVEEFIRTYWSIIAAFFVAFGLILRDRFQINQLIEDRKADKVEANTKFTAVNFDLEKSRASQFEFRKEIFDALSKSTEKSSQEIRMLEKKMDQETSKLETYIRDENKGVLSEVRAMRDDLQKLHITVAQNLRTSYPVGQDTPK